MKEVMCELCGERQAKYLVRERIAVIVFEFCICPQCLFKDIAKGWDVIEIEELKR